MPVGDGRELERCSVHRDIIITVSVTYPPPDWERLYMLTWCTEGEQSRAHDKRASYGGGALAFMKMLDDWREKDTLEGLEARAWEEEDRLVT